MLRNIVVPSKKAVFNARFISNVDADEVAKFKEMSASWWNKDGDVKLLHSMNALRVPFIRDGLINDAKVDKRDAAKPLEGLKILDVGCGGGLLSEPLSRLGAQVTGIDATEHLIKIAKEHMSLDTSLADNLSYEYMSVEEMALREGGKFDAVVSSEVIEHVTEKQAFVKGCVDCVKPNGSIFLTTVSKTLASKVLGIFVAENVLGLIRRGTHQYEKFICPHDLQRLLEERHCTTKKIQGLAFNPLTGKWGWISSTDLTYALHAVKNLI